MRRIVPGLAAVALWAAPTAADVTISGTVRYWGPAGERPDLKEVLSAPRPEIAGTAGLRRGALGAYDRWLERAAAGGLDLDTLEARVDIRESAAAQRTELRAVIEREESSSDEILRLTSEIQRTIAEIDASLTEPLEADLEGLRQAAADVGEGDRGARSWAGVPPRA